MNPLENAQAELGRLLETKAQINADIDRKIEAVQKAIQLFWPVYGQEEASPKLENAFPEGVGMTEAIEVVLMASPDKPLPATSIRNGLLEAGFKLSGNNPMAAIHQVLKRLVARGNWFVSEEIDGQTMYKYDSSRHPYSHMSVPGLHPSQMPATFDPITTPSPKMHPTIAARYRKKDEK